MLRSDIDVMQTTILTPLPGTRLFEQYQQEGRLLYTDFPQDWGHYDMTEVVHRPGNMQPGTLTAVNNRLNQRMYALPSLLHKALGTLWRTRDMTTTMFAWNSNLNYRNVGKGLRKVRAEEVLLSRGQR